MLYKSKAKIVWLVLSVLFAIAAIVFVILNLALNDSLYLTISIGLATFFFVCKGISDLIDSKYTARKDQPFMRHLAYGFFIGGGICLIIFIFQLVSSLI